MIPGPRKLQDAVVCMNIQLLQSQKCCLMQSSLENPFFLLDLHRLWQCKPLSDAFPKAPGQKQLHLIVCSRSFEPQCQADPPEAWVPPFHPSGAHQGWVLRPSASLSSLRVM